MCIAWATLTFGVPEKRAIKPKSRYDRRSYLKNRITKPKARCGRRSYLAFERLISAQPRQLDQADCRSNQREQVVDVHGSHPFHRAVRPIICTFRGGKRWLAARVVLAKYANRWYNKLGQKKTPTGRFTVTRRKRPCATRWLGPSD